jgi:ABC-type phosphate/phosphonate transport system substrate-binding protein
MQAVRNIRRICYVFITVIALAAFFATNLQAAFVFSAPPKSNNMQEQTSYGPLIKYIEEVIGETVVYDRPEGWEEYSHKMRNGQYDIILDAPHFTSWRIENINHEPIARLPGELRYTMLVNKTSTRLNKIRDIVGEKICAPESPQLGTMTVYNLFANPVFMPQIHEITGGFKDVYNALRNGECKAAIVRDVDYIHLIPAEKNNVKLIAKSDLMPAHTITISQKLLAKKMLLSKMLISARGSRAIAKVLSLYGKREHQMLVPVEKNDYRGLDHLLTDVVWGW